jgi:SAM-dependent methyltransferase
MRELFRVDQLPVLQNRVYSRREEALAARTGDIVLVQEPATGLIYNRAFDPTLMVYDEAYQNEQACSPAFRAHLDDVLSAIGPLFGGERVLEIGCGKGYFLELMRAAGYAATGIDPAYEGDSPHVIKASFEPGLGLRAGGIVLRHVLEHIPAPESFLDTVARANGGKGLIYIEVPCFDWICEHRAWFDIFYEHVNFFRLSDFRRMFANIRAAGHLFGGQYLYVIADLASLRVPKAQAGDHLALPQDFSSGIDVACAQAAAHAGSRAIWGGSSKGVIFSTHLARRGIGFDAVIDINPVKQGRYIAVTGLPIVSPQEAMVKLAPGSLVFVMNSNYLAEIIGQSQGRFEYREVST